MTDLDKLIEAIAAGMGVSTRFTRSNAIQRPASSKKVTWIEEAYYGSLDAAKALKDALLPGWGWETGVNATSGSIAQVWKSGRDAAFSATAEDPARAWLLAILKAYRTTQEATP